MNSNDTNSPKRFNLTPTIFDKLKGNTLLVKKSELQNVSDYIISIKNDNSMLTEEIISIRNQNENLKKELNEYILNNEIGYKKELNENIQQLKEQNIQQEIQNEKLRNQVKNLKAMEDLYIQEIKKLRSQIENNLIAPVNSSKSNKISSKKINQIKNELKSEIENELKSEIKNSIKNSVFEELQKIDENSIESFEILV